jgi:hypothetical protein
VAGGKSTYLANAILDHMLGGPDYVRPATVYIGIFTTAPSAGGSGGVEATGGGYARIPITNNATNFPASSSGIKYNGVAFNWSAFTANMGTFNACGIFDAASGGNLLRWGPLNAPRTVNSGEGFQIPVNGATFTEA